MVLLQTSDEWQRQSSLLLQARPTTTRVTTKYNIPNLDSPKYANARKRKRDAGAGDEKDAPRVPRGTLTLKTHDPESGVVLKFKTDRSAEVGRLIGGLGRLGRHMAALPARTEDVTMDDAPAVAEQAAPAPAPAPPAGPVDAPAPVQENKAQPGSGGGKKKKKNKK